MVLVSREIASTTSRRIDIWHKNIYLLWGMISVMKQYWNFYYHGYDSTGWIGVDILCVRCGCLSFLRDMNYPILLFQYFLCHFRPFVRAFVSSNISFVHLVDGKNAETSLVRATFLSTIQCHVLSLHIWFLRLLLFLTQWWNWYFIKGRLFDKRNERNIHSRPFDSDIHAVNLAQGICENNIFFVRKIYISSVRTHCKYGIEWITFAECFVIRKGLSLQFMLNFVCLFSGSVAIAVVVFLHDECTTKARTNIHVCIIIDTEFLAEFDRVCK